MKNLLLISSLALIATSCVPDKDKRDKRKADHSAEHLRNDVDSSVFSGNGKKVDTVAFKKDSVR